MLRSETAKLRSSQFALMIGGETLKRLEEGLLRRSEVTIPSRAVLCPVSLLGHPNVYKS